MMNEGAVLYVNRKYSRPGLSPRYRHNPDTADTMTLPSAPALILTCLDCIGKYQVQPHVICADFPKDVLFLMGH